MILRSSERPSASLIFCPTPISRTPSTTPFLPKQRVFLTISHLPNQHTCMCTPASGRFLESPQVCVRDARQCSLQRYSGVGLELLLRSTCECQDTRDVKGLLRGCCRVSATACRATAPGWDVDPLIWVLQHMSGWLLKNHLVLPSSGCPSMSGWLLKNGELISLSSGQIVVLPSLTLPLLLCLLATSPSPTGIGKWAVLQAPGQRWEVPASRTCERDA